MIITNTDYGTKLLKNTINDFFVVAVEKNTFHTQDSILVSAPVVIWYVL